MRVEQSCCYACPSAELLADPQRLTSLVLAQ